MVWATLSPDPTATAPYAIPNAPAYRPRPTAARRIAGRLITGSRYPNCSAQHCHDLDQQRRHEQGREQVGHWDPLEGQQPQADTEQRGHHPDPERGCEGDRCETVEGGFQQQLVRSQTQPVCQGAENGQRADTEDQGRGDEAVDEAGAIAAV